MPVSAEVAESNRSERERLVRLVRSLDNAALRTRLPNGWTVAGALGHLAFWDRQRLCLIRRWAAGDIRSGAYDSDVFNDAVQPLLEMIPPERVAAAAVQAAEEIDALLLELPDEMIEAALARPDAPHVDRGEHRRHHLDRIEESLGGKRGVVSRSE
jgi:Mycothiol maleylpyruvate isomerase N-terminal domain